MRHYPDPNRRPPRSALEIPPPRDPGPADHHAEADRWRVTWQKIDITVPAAAWADRDTMTADDCPDDWWVTRIVEYAGDGDAALERAVELERRAADGEHIRRVRLERGRRQWVDIRKPWTL